MPQRARSGRQLAIELPPELLQRLKAHAAATDRPVAALVRRWIEAGLDGALAAGPAGADPAGLAARVEALEAAVSALQQSRPPRPPKPAPVAESLPLELGLDPSGPAPEPPAGAITTAELAERTGTNRPAWNNWAGPERVGQVRHHPQAGGWRLVGKAPTEAGGPARWLWEPA